jgi:hypothetical protein
MLQCPRCDTPNPVTNRYCDQCGSSLLTSNSTPPDIPEQPEYISRNDYPSPPQSEYGVDTSSQLLFYQKISPPEPKITVFWVVRAILYFIAMFIAGAGLFGSFTSISSSHTMVGLGLFFWLGLLVAAVVLFRRVRHRTRHLRFWQLVGWICGATVGAFMATILDSAFFSDFSKNPVGSFIFGCVVLLYGLIIAGAALW